MEQNNQPYDRYQRQIILKGFGAEGQQKLLGASVLVVGAGGLGCPALQYLAAAGVGTIGIVDDDSVSLHNLHRQVLFTTNDIGLSKTSVAEKRLRQMNPGVQIRTYALRLTNQNAISILQDYDVVLDATDNFATRYVINDGCVLLNKPVVYGALSQFEGQVAVFNAGKASANYRDLFPEPPPPGSVLNCAEAGVLGVLPGMIGILQATEAIKLLTGIGKPLVNQLFTYNALTCESFVFALTAKEETAQHLPKTTEEFEGMNYVQLCEAAGNAVEEIDAERFAQLLQQPGTAVIDVRNEGELPAVTEFTHRQIPLAQLPQHLGSIRNNTVVFFCQSGKRSREAAKIFSTNRGSEKNVYSLRGGIINWKTHGTTKG